MLQSAALPCHQASILTDHGQQRCNAVHARQPTLPAGADCVDPQAAAGDWKPNEAIPSEQVLARSFNVSTGTIRKAVDALVAANILVRQQGKGTFVATHTEDRTLFYFYHIARKDGVKELPVHELLSFRKGRAEAEEAQRLAIGRNPPTLRMQNALKLGGATGDFRRHSGARHAVSRTG